MGRVGEMNLGGPKLGQNSRDQAGPQQPQNAGHISKTWLIRFSILLALLIPYFYGQNQIKNLESEIDHLRLKLDTFKDELLTYKIEEIKNVLSKYS